MKTINIGILGYGTVGKGTVDVLVNNYSEIKKKLGFDIKLYMIASRSIKSDKLLSDIILTEDLFEVVNNEKIDIVVELIGGDKTSYDVVIKAIENKKHVVTANKKLLAIHGNEIFKKANKNNVMVLFEAAVAGGVPIIKVLKESLVANKINSIAGIINGTCNFILSEMRAKSLSFKEALKKATKLGYAEKDPKFDVEGIDAAHKITIMSALAFGTNINFNKCYIEGINHLHKKDIKYADELGYQVKLLGITKKNGNSVELRVHPSLIPNNLLIANVKGVMNAVYVDADKLGSSIYYGAGAGSSPTASAVVSDIVDIARNINCQKCMPNLSYQPKEILTDSHVIDIEDIVVKYYLRIVAVDKKGVLAKISDIFDKHDISIKAIIQKKATIDKQTDIVILTHDTKEKKIKGIISELDAIYDLIFRVIILRVEDFS